MSVIITIGAVGALLGTAGVIAANEVVGEVADTILLNLESDVDLIEDVVVNYPSKFRRIDLLEKVFINLGSSVKKTNRGHLLVDINKILVEAYFNEERQGIDLFFIKTTEKKATKLSDQIHEEYGNVVQEKVYEKLKNEASQKGLELESEELSNDDSIVLTYTVNNNI